MPRHDYAILGAGALGSILGAHLAHAGHDVVVLARGRRAAQIAADGLRIEGLTTLKLDVPVLTDPAALQGVGTLIVATKAIGTAQALAPLRHAAIDAVLSIQNGTQKNELLAAAFGADRVLGAVANFSGELLVSGVVAFTRNVDLRIGELHGAMTTRVQHIVGAIDAAGIRASASTSIIQDEWSKFAAWVGLMALSVTTRRNTWEFLGDPISALTLVRLVREVGQLAADHGVQITGVPVLPVRELCESPDERAVATVLAIGESFMRDAPTHRVSALQDLDAGRPLELEETLGHAVAMAERRGLALPTLRDYYRRLLCATRATS